MRLAWMKVIVSMRNLNYNNNTLLFGLLDASAYDCTSELPDFYSSGLLKSVHLRENLTLFGEIILYLGGIEGHHDLSRSMTGYLV